ncbi:hypothetical protein CVT24_004495 [Panaeolus cyanescens]|uniref:VPS37 C-terminal domain-containing protein n=1 Tax=Panaeolus cyanescens TaxID=181874 RepID=A0A409YBQ1_9AGAR|nr:hypothetical protein CVT24_004495 [Panaeolus cyanescens]
MATQLLQEFPELSNLSREDLEDLLSDPVYFQAVFHSLSNVKEMYKSQAELGMANQAIAQNNLALQQKLYDLRSATKDAFDEAKHLEGRWKDLEKEQREVYQRFTPQFLLMRLKHSITAQDEASEALASSFVQSSSPHTNDAPAPTSTRGGQDVDEFIKQFRESRRTYHKRSLFSEKWANGQVIWRD